ncbi:MAG: NAD(P)H-hydrate dehydratase [Bacteroidaceae bacterium]|nr:NAD(P)H-hydrate dehydratase [Bacteroidaceae bacterium]
MIRPEPIKLDINRMAEIYRIRPADAHKGTMGHALLVAGRYGMAGCASLAAEACLRSGVGKLTIHTIRKNRNILQMNVPEAILHLDSGTDFLRTSVQDFSPYQSVGMGPGLGTKASTCLARYLEKCDLPMVLDADALNLLAQNPALLQKMDCILTPHVGEMQRLAKGFGLDGEDMYQCAVQMATERKCIVVLKGYHTKICLPDGSALCCPRGNAGMATAGSGDVLTGIITGLLAQGYKLDEAAALGVWLHASAGDYAAEKMGQECMLARDIIIFLPQAFSEIKKIKNI